MRLNTILIVDDTPSARDILEGALYKENYQLLFAENGLEALQIVETQPIDVILLDVMMPGMDGFEVCQHIRAIPHLAEITIIMITALDDRNSKLRGIEVGADDFINKPFDHLELRTRLRTITKLNRYRRLVTERARFNWVLEQVQEGYLVINEQDQILYANQQAQLYLNLPPTPLDPALTFRQLSQQSYTCQPEEIWANWPNPATPYYLVRPETPTTQDLWLQVNLFEQSSQPQTEYVIRLQNITSEIASQRIMWAFHEQISHKIRTPLSHVIMSLKLLTYETKLLTAEDMTYFIKTAEEGATRLENSVDEVFEYLDIMSSDAIKHQPLVLNSLAAIIEEIRIYLELQTVNLILADPDLAQASIPLCEHKLHLIFWKLLENAKKFHPENQPHIQITVSAVGATVQIQIQDDGIHISPEALTKVWLPYYQGDKYFTGEMEGMGLGLTVVASLVWGVNGHCHIYNRPDQPGVIIELTLPRR